MLSKSLYLPPRSVRLRCREIAIEAAAKHHCPPAHVMAHVRTKAASCARVETMQKMFKMGMRRVQIAMAFGRDVRRVRSSVIGGPPRCTCVLKIMF